MSYVTEGQAIRQHVSATWTQTPVQFPNVAFDPTPGEPWARLTILPVSSERLTIGGKKKVRYGGMVVFQLFVKPDTGDGEMRTLADTATDMFTGPGLSGLLFFDAEARQEGLDDFGWVGWTIEARFQRDEVI